MVKNQHTISQEVSFSGKGLHSGLNANITIKPAAVNHGIKFQRIDLEGAPIVAALAENVIDTSRSTTIGASNGAKVITLEHLMGALYASEIDNALIEIDSVEVPILDGSAALYIEKFQEVGVTEQDAKREYFTIDKKMVYEDSERGVKIEIFPDDSFSANVNVDFDSRVVGRQYSAVTSNEEISTNIAPCRTFVFLHELMPLIDNNLIKGGDINNALVIVEKPLPADELEKLSKIFDKVDLSVEKSGYLNNVELRGDNEIARHKMLDLIGDLYLIGKRINGKVFATRPGHKANTEMAKIIRKEIKASASKPNYKYDINKEPVYDINKIKTILPHRPPFLLVDKILELTETSVVGIKNVTMNEPFFVGHFPEEPVMPGVLQLEAMAQCGGILALSTVDEPHRYSTYFARIDNVKFKRKVVPGDTLMFILELTEPIRRGMVMMQAKSFVGDQLVCEAFLVAQIAKNK
ncbi:MAG: bifunctional UDP-3-O-[3-hydroxymyristoyl] N-acetylglucosamine deacetylase/3-hydroxyacyl-ACP dehydratase [Rikenellaceae bacterium]